MQSPHLAQGGTFLSPCSCWIRFCQLNLFQKLTNFFKGENLHQLGYFETLPSSLSLIKVVPLKMSIFLAFQRHARQG